jgi:molybdate transport system substrate-binding protein
MKMPGTLRILSGGAAQGLVQQLQQRFAEEKNFAIRGTFGAVGAMRDKLLAGEPCDLLILTQAIIEQLAADKHVIPGSERPLGIVKTGVAVKEGQPLPDVSTPEALRAALLAAKGVYLPDPEKATAGIHFMKVLKTLGIDGELASRLHPYPNGAAAMRELQQCPDADAIGCTQVTEILFAPGVQLAGLLPAQFELATVYTAAVCSLAEQPAAAVDFIRLMTSDAAAEARRAAGFEPAA